MNILLEINEGPWALFFIGFSIVFVVLTFLVLVFNLTPKIISMLRTLMNPVKKEYISPSASSNTQMTGAESAAIAAAIHFYFNQNHDEESNIITIKRIERRYTPWNSKIYGLRNWRS